MTYQQPQYPAQQTSGQPYSPSPVPGFGYPPPPQPPKKKAKWPWIVGGIVLAMILGCVGLSMAGLFGAAKVVNDMDQNHQGQNAAAGVMGKPAVDGKFQFTVTKMRCGVDHVGSTDFGDQAQGSFCLVDVTVKNVGGSPEMFDSGSQTGLGTDGTRFTTDTGAETDVNDQGQTFLENINPGNQVKGTLVFDVPKGAELASIVMHESSFTAGINVPLK